MSPEPPSPPTAEPPEHDELTASALLAALERERAELLRAALSIASSRSWRLAWKLHRLGTRLSFRRAGNRSALDTMIERLVNLELRYGPLEARGDRDLDAALHGLRGKVDIVLWDARDAAEAELTIKHLRDVGARRVMVTGLEATEWDLPSDEIRVIHAPPAGPSGSTAAVDAALRASDGDLVVLLRAGLRVPRDWVRRLRMAAGDAGEVGLVATVCDSGVLPRGVAERPPWLTPEAVSLLIGGEPGERLRVAVFDAGCIALTRPALASAGGLDPRIEDFQMAMLELGERIREHDLACVLADDVLVHDTRSASRQSRSRRRGLRRRLVAANEDRREGRGAVRSMVALERAITRVTGDPPEFAETVSATGRKPLSITWVVPTVEGQARPAALAACADVAGLRQLGLGARVAVPAEELHRIPELDAQDAMTFDSEDHLASLVRRSDVLVAAHPLALPMLGRVRSGRSHVVIACVLRTLPSDPPDGDVEDVLLMAPSRWLCDRVMERFDRHVQPFALSADNRYFRPTPDDPATADRLRIAAWLRPVTLSDTLAVLDGLAQRLAPGASLVTFGTAMATLERKGAPGGAWRERHLGTLDPARRAQLLGQTDILLDLTPNLPIGELAAEAMACGAIPVVNSSSAAAEIIENGTDGIVLESGEPASWLEAIVPLDTDWPRLRALQTGALQASARRPRLLTAIQQYTLFERARGRVRRTRVP